MNSPQVWLASALTAMATASAWGQPGRPEVEAMRNGLESIRESMPKLERAREEGDPAPQVGAWAVLAGEPLASLEAGKRYVIAFPGHMSAESQPERVLEQLRRIGAEFKEEDMEVIAVLWNTAEDKVFAEAYLRNHRRYLAATKSAHDTQGIRVVDDPRGAIVRAWFPPRSLGDGDTFVVDAGKIAWKGRLRALDANTLRSVLNGDHARAAATQRLDEAIARGQSAEADKALGELLALGGDAEKRRALRDTYGRKIAGIRQAAEAERSRQEKAAKILGLHSLFESRMAELQEAEQAGDVGRMAAIAADFRGAIPGEILPEIAPFAYLLDWKVATRRGDVAEADRMTAELLAGDTRALGFRQLLLISQLNTRAPGRPANFKLAAQAAEMAMKEHSPDYLPSGESGEDREYRMCLRLLANARAGEGRWEDAARVTRELLSTAKKWEPESVAAIEAFLTKCQSEAAEGAKPR